MSKFKALGNYTETLKSGYQLLPFNFTTLNDYSYVLSNSVGEYITSSRKELDDFINHRLEANSNLYNNLKAKHFLIDEDSNVAVDLLTLKYRTKMARLADFTGLHIFVATLRCEHSCPYCQVSRQNDDAHSAFDMTPETADKALSLVFRSPSPAIKIEFQGGEPLLNFPIIQYIVEKAEVLNTEFGKDLQFVIATNLAVVTDEILEYCRLHNIFISTSLDGPAHIHNKNRPRPEQNSYEKAVSGIQKTRQILGKDSVGALMTTTQLSLSHPYEIIDEYIQQGFNSIFLRPLSPYGFAIKTKSFKSYDVDEWLEFYFKSLDYIIDINKQGHFFVEQYAALILSKMLTPFSNGYVDLMSPAGIGIGAVVYNYDGDVHASDESRMLAEMGDKTFCLGNVHEHSYEDLFTSEALLKPLEDSFAGSAPMCSECAFEPYCGADPVYHYATERDFVGHKPSSAFCNRNMTICRKLILMMERDPDIKDIFLNWVNV